jgi:hypothetical protein
VNTRNLIVGAIAVAFLGWLVLGPEEEPIKTDGGRDSGSEGDDQTLPRAPEPLAPQHRYGIAGGAQPGAETPSGSPPPYYRGQPPTQAPAYRPVEPQPDPMERYSFRPLTDRERQRLSRERPADNYGVPTTPPPAPTTAWIPEQPDAAPRYYGSPPSYGAPQRYGYPAYGADGGPNPYGPPPGYAGEPAYRQPTPYPDWQAQSYRFRPHEAAQGAGGRWEGPYPEPGWGREPELADPWASPSDPRQGSAPRKWAPPAERMYPALDWGPDRKLTSLD